MSVKFFGQFLIEQGEIDAAQLREALACMDTQNKPMGEIAVEAGYLTRDDADRINLEQRRSDRPFGELACELGMLSEAQVSGVIATQQKSRVQIGAVLVELGSVEIDRLPQLLDEFKADQAPYETQARTLPGELADNPVAHLVLDLMPKLCLRIAKMRVKAGFGLPLSKLASSSFNVALRMEGSPGLQVTLLADEPFARTLAAATARIDEGKLDHDFIYDGLGEFLNVLCGNVAAVLERDDVYVSLGPPMRDAALGDGIAFELAVGKGCASLVLAVP